MVRLAYEVLDVHPATTKQGIRSVLIRWVERRVLARCHLLVISSPAFLRNYFQPVQGYQGKALLLENKWPGEELSALPRHVPWQLSDPDPIWTIGWFGNIRCPQSLKILTELADTFPQHVRIYIRGHASLLGERELLDQVNQRENVIFEGEYAAPDELPLIYSNIHFNWCVDLCDDKNSAWLLPNRLYEGGYFGIPALAIADHETGRVVQDRNLGIVLESPIVECLGEVLSSMTRERYRQLRQGIEQMPGGDFVDQGDVANLVDTVVRTTSSSAPRTKVPDRVAYQR